MISRYFNDLYFLLLLNIIFSLFLSKKEITNQLYPIYKYCGVIMGCLTTKQPRDAQRTQKGYFNQQIKEGLLPDQTLNNQIFSQLDSSILASLEIMQETKQNIMGSKDWRKPIERTLQYPYSSIGLVLLKFRNKNYYGTGFLVGPNIVATCAHNCFNTLYGRAEEIIFYPALNEFVGESFKVKKFYYPKEYEKDEADNYDFAILEIEEKIGKKYGTIGLDFSDKEKGDQAYVYGYPGVIFVDGEKVDAKKKMYGMKGKWKRHQNEIRYDKISTSQGQSGSPILIKKNGSFYAIGIHIKGNSVYNSGVNLDDRVRMLMNKWISQFGKISNELYLRDWELQDHKIEILGQKQNPNLEYLNLNCNKITETGVRTICQKFKDLQYLDLGSNQITTFPSEISELPHLKELEISHNQLSQLPQQIGELIYLKSLWISSNKIKTLPESIGKLQALQGLWIQKNRFTTLPESIKNLINLEALSLNYNQFEELPSQIGSLTNLKYLEMSGNYLSDLPESLNRLTRLQKLSIDDNQFSQLPEPIQILCQIKQLWISDNKISKLPSTVKKLTHLKKLQICRNNLTRMPKQIGKLSNLEILGVSNNQIKELPTQIGNLICLKKLEISDNKLQELPQSIWNIKQLQSLQISQNRISHISSSLGQLNNLIKLDLSSNRLTQLPRSIGQLLNLKELWVSKNKLIKIPEEIIKLTNLEILSVLQNQIIDLPTQIGSLTNLKGLEMSSNKVEKLPNSIGNLKNLEKLYIYNNLMTQFPEQITQLKNLMSFKYHGNHLSKLSNATREFLQKFHQ